MTQVTVPPGENDHSRTVSRECHHQLVNLSLDSLYLVVEYPYPDLFHHWSSFVGDLSDPRLFDGIPADKDFVLRRGAHGYKLSAWDGDARLYVTDRVNQTLQGTVHEGQGMGALLQLGPKWLKPLGEAFAPNTLRRNIVGQLDWFGILDPKQYPIRINRLDIALDVLGLDADSFSVDAWRRGWVGFAKPGDFYQDRRTGRLTGLTVGSRAANVSLVVYDKVRESEKRGSQRFWRSVWGVGEDDDVHVTRFEWSFRCHQARFTNLRYLADYSFEGFLGLLNYATRFWGQLRQLEGGDEHHKDRRDLHPLWEELLAFIGEYSFNYEQLVRPEYVLEPDIKPAYLRALAGWLTGLRSRVGAEEKAEGPASLEEALAYLYEAGPDAAEMDRRAQEKWVLFSRLAGGGG
jgi:hypothetical protein